MFCLHVWHAIGMGACGSVSLSYTVDGPMAERHILDLIYSRR